MKAYIVIHHCDGNMCGDSSRCAGVFVSEDDAKACLAKEYWEVKPKDEYLASWNNPDDEENDGFCASFIDNDDSYHEWHIEYVEIK